MADYGWLDNDKEENDRENDEEDENGNGDDGTTPLLPDSNSTSSQSGEHEHIQMKTMSSEKEKGPENAVTSFIEGKTYSRVIYYEERAWEALTDIFPDAKATELEASYSKTGRLQVKMFGHGKNPYFLFTKDQITREEKLNSSLT